MQILKFFSIDSSKIIKLWMNSYRVSLTGFKIFLRLANNYEKFQPFSNLLEFETAWPNSGNGSSNKLIDRFVLIIIY